MVTFLGAQEVIPKVLWWMDVLATDLYEGIFCHWKGAMYGVLSDFFTICATKKRQIISHWDPTHPISHFFLIHFNITYFINVPQFLYLAASNHYNSWYSKVRKKMGHYVEREQCITGHHKQKNQKMFPCHWWGRWNNSIKTHYEWLNEKISLKRYHSVTNL